ncbi:MAG: carbon storage regulator CsrA [SAR324 cluster bacterium]|uniref:Translational regulator CsrA n=1 Tax=SAR324 cluster bacterium TaxID=2024889 RepID=A0A7X9FPR6_9DELT|nr:carbon storage regulator CsrA [SAR324 cluster bacterium]
MLILTRKRGESIYIGGRIKVTVVEIKGNQVRVGIDAPQEERVYREEIYLQILEENRQAAEAVSSEAQDINSLSDMWEKKGGAGTPTSNLSGIAPRQKLSSLTKASVKGQEIPVFKRRKKEKSDE